MARPKPELTTEEKQAALIDAQYKHEQLKERNRKYALGCIVVVLGLIGVCAVIGALDAAGVFGDKTNYEIRYVAWATASDAGEPGRAMFFYTSQNDQEDTVTDRYFTQTLKLPAGTSITFTGHNQLADGTVHCDVYVNGDLWRTDEVTGGYQEANCTGFLPSD